MMDKAGYDIQAESSELPHLAIVPWPSSVVADVIAELAPREKDSEASDPDCRDAFKILQTVMVSRFAHLIAPFVSHPGHAALESAPNLGGRRERPRDPDSARHWQGRPSFYPSVHFSDPIGLLLRARVDSGRPSMKLNSADDIRRPNREHTTRVAPGDRSGSGLTRCERIKTFAAGRFPAAYNAAAELRSRAPVLRSSQLSNEG